PTTAPAATTSAPAPTAAPAAAPTTAGSTTTSKVLHISTNAAPPNFNPLIAVSTTQQWFFNTVMSSLTKADPEKQDLVPDLAESWEVSPDGTSYTFKIRQNAVWHDGTPVTAKDVFFTYMLYLNPKTESKRASALSMIKGADAFTNGKTDNVPGITQVDDQTIKFDMEYPNVLFLNQTILSILPAHLLGSIAPADLGKNAFFSSAPVGSGPFKFVNYVPDQSIQVEPNQSDYIAKPKINQIIFPIIVSPDTTQVAMERGEIQLPVFDGGTATTALYKEFVADPKWKLLGIHGGTLISYAFNDRRKYLQDERMHQAFLYALDRQKLINTFNGGNGTIVNSFMVHPWYQKPEWNKMYPYDPAKAKDLLKQMNWDSSRQLNVTVITLANDEIRSEVAAEQQMLAEVGIKISFKEVALPVWVSTFYDTHDYDLIRVTFGTFPDPDGFLSFHMTTDSKNAMGYANPDLDKLIKEGRETVDKAKRIAVYQQINEEMLKLLPLAPVFLQNEWDLLSRRFHIPELDTMKPATSLSDVPIAPSFLGSLDVYGLHQETWDLT
ncbi:MAG: ABC transporter substrate-binding protein, partial [Chloroflexota bacterium]